MNNPQQTHTAQPATVTAVLQQATAELAAAGVPSPAVDAQLMLGHVLQHSRGQVQAASVLQTPLSAAAHHRFTKLLQRRLTREPLQHILGTAPFYGLDVQVGPGVFVPRPETELLVSAIHTALQSYPPAQQRIADFCAGSGAIACALAQQLPQANITALEKSVRAYSWLQRNRAQHAPQLQLLHCDLIAAAEHLGITPLPGEQARATAGPPSAAVQDWLRHNRGRLTGLVSNPPYVPAAAIPTSPEVRDYDPAAALYSGTDGLALLRHLLPLAAWLAAPGAHIAIEHTETQGPALTQMLQAVGFQNTSTRQDLSGRARFTTGVFQGTA